MPSTGFVSVNTDDAYKQSFADLPDMMTYYDPCGAKTGVAYGLQELVLKGSVEKPSSGFDLRPVMKANLINSNPKLKALTTGLGGSGTTDVVLTPFYLDTLLLDRSFKYTPARAIFPRVANKGLKAVYDVITSKSMSNTYAEGGAILEKDFTPARVSADMKYLYSKGRVTGQAIAAVPSFQYMGALVTGTGVGTDVNVQTITAENAKKLAVLAHTQSLFELEENLIFNGYSTTSAVTGDADGTEYNGIIQTQSTTNGYNAASTPLTLEMIDTAAQYAFDDGGRPTVAFCSSNVFTQLIGLLSAKNLLAAGMYQTVYGFTAIRYLTVNGAVDIIPSQYLTNTTNSKYLLFIDLRGWEMRVLQDLTYKDLPDEDDSQVFLLKMYEVPICRNVNWNASIYAIA